MKHIREGDLITIVCDELSHLYRVVAIGVEPNFEEPFTTTLKLFRVTRTEEDENA